MDQKTTSNGQAELQGQQQAPGQQQFGFSQTPPAIQQIQFPRQAPQIRPMPFNTDDRTPWFAHFEALLRVNKAERGEYYDTLMASLNKEALSAIRTLLMNPPINNRYETLKAALVEAHSKTEGHRIRQLLMGQRLGDRQPSKFLNELLLLAPETVDSSIIKECWLKELPPTTRAILMTIDNQSLQDMAKAADAIQEQLSREQQIHAIRTANPSSELSSIMSMLKEMQEQIRQLQANQRTDRGRPRARSQSRQPRDQSNSRAPNQDGLCFYHARFKEHAHKCEKPCSFQPKN